MLIIFKNIICTSRSGVRLCWEYKKVPKSAYMTHSHAKRNSFSTTLLSQNLHIVRQPKLFIGLTLHRLLEFFLWIITHQVFYPAGYQENILWRFEKNAKIQGQSSNFKVKYIFFLNKATNKCNTSISSNFD